MSYRHRPLAGLLLGLTFLAHTAPALLLALVIVTDSTLRALRRNREERSTAFRRLGLILATAFVTSLPFTSSILFHHGLRVRNQYPSSWVWEPLRLENLASFLRQHVLRPEFLVLAAAAVAAWVRPKGPGTGRSVIGVWLAGSILGLLWSYVLQLLWARGPKLRASCRACGRSRAISSHATLVAQW